VGSGTTLAVAEKLKRRWIGCDLGRWAIHVTRKRLQEIEGCSPLEILNLGRYERKYWQGGRFGDGQDQAETQAISEYVQFILKLYGAEQRQGQHVHGAKGSRTGVHIGAIDVPVTIDEVTRALSEARAIGLRELHVLGWEWEMGIHDLLIDMAKRDYDVFLKLLEIPREVMDPRAVDAGIEFYDLAFLEVEAEKVGVGVRMTIKTFVAPDSESSLKDVHIEKWSDLIDYWAVDWDFRSDTFVSQWQAFRTSKNRVLSLTSDVHVYKDKRAYRILVKVIDIFGRDTSRLIEWREG
jgi:adenine-specific DNA-methyltransferase